MLHNALCQAWCNNQQTSLLRNFLGCAKQESLGIGNQLKTTAAEDKDDEEEIMEFLTDAMLSMSLTHNKEMTVREKVTQNAHPHIWQASW